VPIGDASQGVLFPTQAAKIDSFTYLIVALSLMGVISCGGNGTPVDTGKSGPGAAVELAGAERAGGRPADGVLRLWVDTDGIDVDGSRWLSPLKQGESEKNERWEAWRNLARPWARQKVLHSNDLVGPLQKIVAFEKVGRWRISQENASLPHPNQWSALNYADDLQELRPREESGEVWYGPAVSIYLDK